MRMELFQKLILGFQFTGTFFFIRENFERETILGLRRHYRGLLTITTAEQLQNKTAICSSTQKRWIGRYFFTTASFLVRRPPPYQLKLMSGHTASSCREGTEQQTKKSKMRAEAEGRGGWKAVEFMYIHTQSLKEEFSGQDYQANDKVVFWQVSHHQPSTSWIFTVVFRMSGRFHTGTSEFPFWAQHVVL